MRPALRGPRRKGLAFRRLNATAKLNDIDPQAWLADGFARSADLPSKQLHELLPWNWRQAAKLLKAY